MRPALDQSREDQANPAPGNPGRSGSEGNNQKKDQIEPLPYFYPFELNG